MDWVRGLVWDKIYIFRWEIYIYIPISFGDQLITLITGVEGQLAIRSEIETQWWVLTPIPFPVVRRPNNSEGLLERGLIVNGLVQGTGPCTLWSIPSDSPSQGNSEWVRGSLKESDVPIIVWGHPKKDLIVNGLVQGTGPCTLWSIPSDSPSQGNSEWVRGSLKESDVPIIVWDAWKGSNSARISSRYRTVYFMEHSEW